MCERIERESQGRCLDADPERLKPPAAS
jgi:hypothetical protein